MNVQQDEPVITYQGSISKLESKIKDLDEEGVSNDDPDKHRLIEELNTKKQEYKDLNEQWKKKQQKLERLQNAASGVIPFEDIVRTGMRRDKRPLEQRIMDTRRDIMEIEKLMDLSNGVYATDEENIFSTGAYEKSKLLGAYNDSSFALREVKKLQKERRRMDVDDEDEDDEYSGMESESDEEYEYESEEIEETLEDEETLRKKESEAWKTLAEELGYDPNEISEVEVRPLGETLKPKAESLVEPAIESDILTLGAPSLKTGESGEKEEDKAITEYKRQKDLELRRPELERQAEERRQREQREKERREMLKNVFVIQKARENK